MTDFLKIAKSIVVHFTHICTYGVEMVIKEAMKLKSVRVHFAYGRIALTFELLGRFGRFLDEDDRSNPPVLLILF